MGVRKYIFGSKKQEFQNKELDVRIVQQGVEKRQKSETRTLASVVENQKLEVKSWKKK